MNGASQIISNQLGDKWLPRLWLLNLRAKRFQISEQKDSATVTVQTMLPLDYELICQSLFIHLNFYFN